MRKEIAKLERLGVDIRTNTAVGKDIPLDDLQPFDAIFLGIGLDKSRKMNIPGEDLPGVISGIDFLRKLNSGELVQLGERVAVIGGGNTAMDAARSALRQGKKVQVLYRRSSREMPAIEEEINDALAEGVQLHTLVAPVRVLGEGGRVTGLELVKMKLGEPDESGRRRPIPIEGSEFRIDIDTVITAIGEQPDFSPLPDSLHHDDWVVQIDETGRTTRPPIFAGGDIVDQPHTVVDAMASGKRAAMAIDTFLCGFDLTAVLDKIRLGDSNSLSMKRYVLGQDVAAEFDNTVVVQPEDINFNYFTSKKRVEERYREVTERIDNFDEVNLGATAEMVFAEALRCFNCGVCNQCDNCIVFCPDFAIHRGDAEHPYLIDYAYCKGCGICAHECPRHAIVMVREEDWQ